MAAAADSPAPGPAAQPDSPALSDACDDVAIVKLEAAGAGAASEAGPSGRGEGGQEGFWRQLLTFAVSLGLTCNTALGRAPGTPDRAGAPCRSLGPPARPLGPQWALSRHRLWRRPRRRAGPRLSDVK